MSAGWLVSKLQYYAELDADPQEAPEAGPDRAPSDSERGVANRLSGQAPRLFRVCSTAVTHVSIPFHPS